MSRLTAPILSAELARMLKSIGSKLSKGKDVGGEIEPVVRLLGDLPSAAISRVEGEIANAAGLWQWPEPEFLSLAFLVRAKLTSREQLGRHDNLKYLFLFHRNGYLREAALRKVVGGLQSPFFVAAVAWRLNDWVAPVRHAAAECARRAFPATSDHIMALAACGLHVHKNSWGRWSSEREILEQVLDRPGVSEHLAELLTVGKTGPLSQVLRQALRSDTLDPHLEMIARNAAQPGVRALAVRVLLSGKAAWQDGSEWKWIDKSMGLKRRVAKVGRRELDRTTSLDQMMAFAAGDRFVAVRKVAIDMLIREPSAFANRGAIAADLARDPNASIRERATFVLEHP